MRLTAIIKKNFKILIRSRTSALIVILGPLLIIILAGLAFNNASSYVVKVGIFSTNYNELTNSFIDSLGEKTYQIKKFETPELCVEGIKQGDIHACILFPDDFRIENDVSNEITFYVDYSKTNLVYMILESVSSTIGMRSEELSLELTTKILDVLQFTETKINEENELMDKLILDSSTLETKISSMNLATPDIGTGILSAAHNALYKDVDLLKNETMEMIDRSFVMLKVIDNDNLTATFENDLEDFNDSYINLHEETLEDLERFNSSVATFDKSLENLEKNLESARTLKANGLNLARGIRSDLEDMKVALSEAVDKINELKVTEAETIVAPITTNIQPVVPEKTYLSYLFPSLVVLLIMMLSIMLSSTLVIMEKTSRAYFRNFTTPTSDITFIGANYLNTLIVSLLQVVIILIIATFIFKTDILAGLTLTALVVFLTITLFSFIGLIIGHFYNSEETASIASISVASLFLLLSNLILPLESMPKAVVQIAQYNPFVVASELLKKAILFSAQIQNVYYDLAILGAYCLVLFMLLVLVQKISKFRFFKGVRKVKEVSDEEKPKEEKKEQSIEGGEI